MRGASVLVLVAGCNWIYGIDDTSPAPAVTCSPVPMFTAPPMLADPGIHNYDTDEHSTIAIGALADDTVSEGPPDGPLQPSVFFDLLPGTTHLHPRLAPSGIEMFAFVSSTVTSYTESAESQWSVESTHTFVGATSFTTFSEPTSGDKQRHILLGDGIQLFEFAQQDVGSFDAALVQWEELGPPFTFDLDAAQDPSMSADGLRLVFRGTLDGHDDVYVAERTDLNTAFTTAHVLYSTPNGQSEITPFMAVDCGRLYFTLGSDLYYVDRSF